MIWLIANSAATVVLLISVWVGLWWFKRAWRVLRIYSQGYTWCAVKTLKGTELSGWVSIIHLRSIHGRIYNECPLFKVITKDTIVTINPTEFDTINEVLGLWKVAWLGGNVGIK